MVPASTHCRPTKQPASPCRITIDFLMNSTRKSLTLLVATLAPLGSPSVNAVGLGELVAQSSLGEPLRAEVRLVRSAGEELDVACFKRVSGAGSDDVPWIYNARLRLVGDRLVVTTREPVNHPIAMLGLQFTCNGELRRDYPILLQPPIPRIATPTAPRQFDAPPAVASDSTGASARPPRATTAPRRLAVAGVDGQSTTAKPARAPRSDAAQHRRAEPPRHDRLILGTGTEAGLVPLRMSLALANPPTEDAPEGTREQLRQEQRTLADIDDRIALTSNIYDRGNGAVILLEDQDRGLWDRRMITEALAMIEGVLEVSELAVRDVMVPRSQMDVVSVDDAVETFLPYVMETAHSRFPVIGDSKDEVLGILLAKDLLRGVVPGSPEVNIRELLRPAVLIPESKKLNVLLKEFRLSRNHMAIVVDEYGGVAGLVTIEDVLEQIVGEIDDEHDEAAVAASTNAYLSGETALTPGMLLSPWAFLAAFGFCLLMNILSAGIPAWRASRMNITDAINQR